MNNTNNINKEKFIADMNGKKMELIKSGNMFSCALCGGTGDHQLTIEHKPDCNKFIKNTSNNTNKEKNKANMNSKKM
ncbi:hypothetical protein [Romboutsia sp.]|uniref:hypothetical protein n=1 Tax=Romboutsia sp. TaxID=1965302 RepID=UPI002D1D2E32|nr:hypothetical protein [Romboutsia sp.]HSQ89597.1 hypothetical protein [Romboutsia sp.]